MDPSTDINQDPISGGKGATSFASDFDMSAINEAVAAGGEADKIQNTFDVNDIELDNTPTTDADLQRQLSDDPSMSLASSSNSAVAASAAPTSVQSAPVTAATSEPKEPAATFVDGDLENEPADDSAPAEAPATIADLANSADDIFLKDPIDDMPAAPAAEEEKPATGEAKETVEETPAQTSVASAPVKKKSKLPIYIIVALVVVAAAAVTIAVIVSAK